MKLKSKHTGEIVEARTSTVENAMMDQFSIKLMVYRGKGRNTTRTSYYYPTLNRILEDWEDA